MDCHSRRAMQNCSYCHGEGDREILRDSGRSSSEFFGEVLGWSILAYGGDSESKEYGGKHQKAVQPLGL